MNYSNDRKELLHILDNQKTVSVSRLKRLIHASESNRTKRMKIKHKEQLEKANLKIKRQQLEINRHLKKIEELERGKGA